MTTFFIAAGAVAFFILGLSITLMRKGRHLQGDVGENDDMKRMGLECTTKAALSEEAALRGEELCSDPGSGCGSCGTTICHNTDGK